MLEAVFISDLHLSPHKPEITSRFKTFLQWASQNTQKLYILGDFLHAWPGDDALDPWSKEIALELKKLSKQVEIFFIHGNRDFLLGPAFADLAGFKIMSDPTSLKFNTETLLTHGDQYCLQDKGHQWLRYFTRNSWFPKLFLKLPLKIRSLIVSQVRQYSLSQYKKKTKSEARTDIVVKAMLNDMQKNNTITIIHGHTHRPGITHHLYNGVTYTHYVLSDWDNDPSPLCYNKEKGFQFIAWRDVYANR